MHVSRDDEQRLARLKAPGLRLSLAGKRAILLGSSSYWKGSKENGTDGTTMQALVRRGLAEARWTKCPHRRLMYLLTDAGAALRQRWIDDEAERTSAVGFAPAKSIQEVAVDKMLDTLHPPAAHTPVAVKCEHCGWGFEDGTDGGGCGRCGLTVRAVT